MFPPKTYKRFAVTSAMAADAALYTFQSNSLLVAWLYWCVVQRKKGTVVYTSTDKSAFLLHNESYAQRSSKTKT